MERQSFQDRSSESQEPSVYRKYTDGFIVRSMAKDDAKIVQKWYTGMGVTSRYDLDVALEVFPKVPGFLIGEYEGEVVASAIRLKCADHCYYGSYLYVDPRMRGKGFANRLRYEVAMEFIGEDILVIDAALGVADANESKQGYITAWLTSRFTRHVDFLPPKFDSSLIIKKATEVDFEELIAYDNMCYIQPNIQVRRDFLHKWIRIPGGASFVAFAGKDIVGFGCRRPCIQKSEHQIGPLYANDPQVAETMLMNLCEGIRGENVTINVWYPNADVARLLERFSFKHVFNAKRQHLHGNPKEFNPRVYGVTSIDVMGF